jgi:NIMA (never in mitosis gene a)-related kinase
VSPEVVASSKYGKKNDIWALGVVAYEMTTLERPFVAESLAPLVMAIIRGRFKPLPTSRSADLRVIITACLQRDPEIRPTASEILDLPFLRDRVARWRAHGDEICAERHALAPQPIPPSVIAEAISSGIGVADGEGSRADEDESLEASGWDSVDSFAETVGRIIEQIQSPSGSAAQADGAAVAGAAGAAARAGSTGAGGASAAARRKKSSKSGPADPSAALPQRRRRRPPRSPEGETRDDDDNDAHEYDTDDNDTHADDDADDSTDFPAADPANDVVALAEIQERVRAATPRGQAAAVRQQQSSGAAGGSSTSTSNSTSNSDPNSNADSNSSAAQTRGIEARKAEKLRQRRLLLSGRGGVLGPVANHDTNGSAAAAGSTAGTAGTAGTAADAPDRTPLRIELPGDNAAAAAAPEDDRRSGRRQQRKVAAAGESPTTSGRSLDPSRMRGGFGSPTAVNGGDRPSADGDRAGPRAGASREGRRRSRDADRLGPGSSDQPATSGAGGATGGAAARLRPVGLLSPSGASATSSSGSLPSDASAAPTGAAAPGSKRPPRSRSNSGEDRLASPNPATGAARGAVPRRTTPIIKDRPPSRNSDDVDSTPTVPGTGGSRVSPSTSRTNLSPTAGTTTTTTTTTLRGGSAGLLRARRSAGPSTPPGGAALQSFTSPHSGGAAAAGSVPARRLSTPDSSALRAMGSRGSGGKGAAAAAGGARRLLPGIRKPGDLVRKPPMSATGTRRTLEPITTRPRPLSAPVVAKGIGTDPSLWP